MKNTLLILAKTNINNLSNTNFGDDGTSIETTIGNIIKAIIGVLALVCVVIIILGGIQYMTSSGDAGKVKKAKDTILYGVIGMVICVLAFAITTFVVSAINGN